MTNNFLGLNTCRLVVRRVNAINYSCMTVAGLSLTGLKPKTLVAQGQPHGLVLDPAGFTR